MAITNHNRVGSALELLRQGLAPYIIRELQSAFKDNAETVVKNFAAQDPMLAKRKIVEWDAAALLNIMWSTWNDAFRQTLGHSDRSLVSECRQIRKDWAHQERFSSDDTDRALDSIARLLAAVSAPEADEVNRMKHELRRTIYDEQMRTEKRRSQAASVAESKTDGALKPWREVITPHRDVQSGHYQQAEFAADLWQVHKGLAADEYKDPVEFFRRTFITEGLKGLLVNAVKRIAKNQGDPVMQLQTNFGGGKTHSMLALYHLFSGTPAKELPGVEVVLEESGETTLPRAKPVVLVGNKISPSAPDKKPDGCVVHTLWGELAWQLGGKSAYERIRADDENATNPGDKLTDLFNEYGPSLVLIDEWVAYARQLHDEKDLAGGSFDTQFTFAQTLTESAKNAKNCLVLISLPASADAGAGASPHTGINDEEVGGARGRDALIRLDNVVKRIAKSWQPANKEEGFEIVRRRLFEPLKTENYAKRDLTARSFSEFYRENHQDFPADSKESEYEKRMRAAYPIHPEVFDQLYSSWSSLVKFQRTRGVLRLMATVIHSLWEKGDRNPLILPCHIPMDDPEVRKELTSYLSDNWIPIIEKDVDGPESLPLQQDSQFTAFGTYSACRKVARTVFLATAPTLGAANQGIDDVRIKLGSIAPGEPPAQFGDALRRLSQVATYLYSDSNHYWYSTQPTVTKLAEDRAEQLKRDTEKVYSEIERRVKRNLEKKGDFQRVHPLPKSDADVADDKDSLGLVVLGPDKLYSKDGNSAAEIAAKAIFEKRGNSPRIYRNMIVFLAADSGRIAGLEDVARKFLAWTSILDEKDILNLTPAQVRQAEQQRQGADSSVSAQIPEVYKWLLVPTQDEPKGVLEWKTYSLVGQEPLAIRAAKKLRNADHLIDQISGARLREHLDHVPLWRGDAVTLPQLLEDFARYNYLPRLSTEAILADAVSDGVGLLTWEQDSFAYADSFDSQTGRYKGLRAQTSIMVDTRSGLVVKPEVARKQLEAETPQPPPQPDGRPFAAHDGQQGELGIASPAPADASIEVGPPKPRRYHGSVVLETTRVGRDAGKIADEVIVHLAGLMGANVKVRLEISAEIPDGAPEHVVRTVTENSRTLKFDSHGFEES